MKSILEVITILVFLCIITLFQKMEEGNCDSMYNVSNLRYPPVMLTPVNNKTASPVMYKYKEHNSKDPEISTERYLPASLKK